MTTLAAGSTINVTLAAGNRLRVTGQGYAIIGTQPQNIVGRGMLGPYQNDMVIQLQNMSATRELNYYTRLPTGNTIYTNDAPDASDGEQVGTLYVTSAGLFTKNADRTVSALGGGAPVTITGGTNVGDLLTAAPSQGWAVTGGQWDIDGTAAGTGLTITRSAAAVGKAYGFTPTGIPFRAVSALTVAGGISPTVLRAVTMENRIPGGLANGNPGGATGEQRCYTKYVHYIGSGNVKRFRLMYMNWFQGSSSTPGAAQTDNTIPITLYPISIVVNGVVAPVTYDGSGTRVMAPGETVYSDWFIPSMFGLSTFARDTKFYTYTIAGIPSASGFMPYANERSIVGDPTGSGQVAWYDPAVTPVTQNQSTGVVTFGGAATTRTIGGLCPFIVGEYESGDPTVMIGLCDSRTAGYRDLVSNSNPFIGYFQKLLYTGTPTAPTNCVSSINLSTLGAYALQYTKANSPKTCALFALGNVAINHGGTNDLHYGNSSGAVVMDRLRATNTDLRSYGVSKIYHTELEPDATGTPPNGTPAGGSGPGGTYDALHTLLVAEVANGGINGLFDSLSIRAGADRTLIPYWNFASTSISTDTLHLLSAGATAMAADIRPQIIAAGVAL